MDASRKIAVYLAYGEPMPPTRISGYGRIFADRPESLWDPNYSAMAQALAHQLSDRALSPFQTC